LAEAWPAGKGASGSAVVLLSGFTVTEATALAGFYTTVDAACLAPAGAGFS
jgi:hypothetical protein